MRFLSGTFRRLSILAAVTCLVGAVPCYFILEACYFGKIRPDGMLERLIVPSEALAVGKAFEAQTKLVPTGAFYVADPFDGPYDRTYQLERLRPQVVNQFFHDRKKEGWEEVASNENVSGWLRRFEYGKLEIVARVDEYLVLTLSVYRFRQ